MYWFFYHREGRKWVTKGLIDSSCIISPAIPSVCSDLCVCVCATVFFFFFSFFCHDSKYEELAGLLQYLVNMYMSVGKSDGERGNEKVWE